LFFFPFLCPWRQFLIICRRGESGIGTWTVIVKDTLVNDFTGTFVDWRLNLWGEAIDGSSQLLHPLPDEHDDDHSIEDAVVATVSINPGTSKTELPPVPTDHIDRPVNEKPSDADATPTAPVVLTPTTTATTAPTTVETSEPATSPSANFLPSFFPTFGASRRTQVWIYASLSLIIVFCLALGAYFFIQRRKRLRNNPHDDYEFDIIDDEEDPVAPLGRQSGRKRRGGELYNAFAGESDEELLSDEDGDGPYRDQPETGLSEKSRDDGHGSERA
jgi:kexin